MTDVEVRLTADLDGATKEVSGFRKEYAQLVKEIEKPLRQVTAFRELENTLESTSRSVRSAKDRVRELGNELARTENPTKELAASYQLAAQELKKLERQELSQTASLRRQQAELKRTGVDTSNLAAEQRRLSAELNKQLSAGRADAAMSSARGSLGVGDISRAQQALVALRAQYRLVAAEGSLSSKERAEAESAYRLRVNQSLDALRKLRAASAAPVSKADIATAETRRQTEALNQAAEAQRKLVLEQARGSLGVGRARELTSQLSKLREQYALLRSTGGLTDRELAITQRTLAARIRETNKEMKELQGLESGRSSLAGAVGQSIGVAGAAYGAVSALRAYVDVTDTAKKMDAQLRLATTSQQGFSKAQEETFKIAQDGQVPLEQVVSTYARLAPALDDIGRRGDAGKVVDALTKALRINGSSSAEASSTLLQFSQAMGSGVLRGEEFNAIAEAAPPLLRAFAKGLNVPTGALRGMAAEGLLTADVITDLAVNALPDLTAAAAQLPNTVDGALTRLRNDLVKAFGDGDTSGLVGAITDLRTLLTDPAVVQGLNDLAAGMINLAGWTVQTSTTFSKFAKEVGYVAALASGGLDEVTRLEKKLENLRENQKTGNPFTGKPVDYSEQIKATEQELIQANARMMGMTTEAYKAAQEAARGDLESKKQAAEEQETIDGQRFSSYSKYVGEMKTIQDKDVADSKKYLRARVSAEKAAGKELAAAQKAQVETQKRYADALAKLNAGVTGDASYSQAQSLKLKAQESLRKGDLAGAKTSAQSALKVLMDLQEAGENTYGFEGFIKSLKAIEDEADKIKLDKAQKSVEAAKEKTKELKDLLEAIKETTITVKMDDAALAKAREQLEKLHKLLGTSMDIGDSVANPDAKSAASKSSPLGAGIDPVATVAPVSQQVVLAKPTVRKDGDNSYTNLPAVPVDIVPTGIRKDGDGSFTNLPAVPVDITPKGIRQDGDNSFTNLPPVGVELEVDKDAAAAAQVAITSLSTQFRQQMQIAVVPVVQGAGATAEASIPALATGGIIRGPGTGTSDSIMIKASNGEGILNARAVQYWGSSLVHQLNRLQMPKFAEGGVVGARVPSIPAFNPQLAAPAAPEWPDLGRMQLDLGGESYSMYVTRDDYAKLALKRGRTVKR